MMSPSVSRGPRPAFRWWIGGAGLAAALWWVFDPSAANRLVAATMAAVCALLLVALLRMRVRLWADRRFLVVTGPWRRVVIPWTQVGGLRVVPSARLGSRHHLLEIDAVSAPAIPLDDPDLLLVLGRFDLGTDPEQVAAELTALRG